MYLSNRVPTLPQWLPKTCPWSTLRQKRSPMKLQRYMWPQCVTVVVIGWQWLRNSVRVGIRNLAVATAGFEVNWQSCCRAALVHWGECLHLPGRSNINPTFSAILLPTTSCEKCLFWSLKLDCVQLLVSDCHLLGEQPAFNGEQLSETQKEKR